MSKCFSSKQITDFFEILEQSNIQYLLPRNINNEIPEALPIDKDIDILIFPSDKGRCNEALLNAGWKLGKHPWDFGSNFKFLYSMDSFRWYTKDSLHIDVSYQLCCRSPNQGEWVPLDQEIQDSAWGNRLVDTNSPWKWSLCVEDELVHLLTRCVFDKKDFNVGYTERIEELVDIVDFVEVESRLKHVFFMFSSTMISLVKSGSYSDIIESYFSFSDY